jgi:hypothetical protein
MYLSILDSFSHGQHKSCDSYLAEIDSTTPWVTLWKEIETFYPTGYVAGRSPIYACGHTVDARDTTMFRQVRCVEKRLKQVESARQNRF